MRKTIKKGVLGMITLIGTIMVPYFIFKTNTKSFSPEATVIYQEDGLFLEVFYNRPYKKGRKIFGGLVPYGEVWRTGANEATTFFTSEDILIDGSLLPAGKYTLWTIPMENSWKIIFNKKMSPWGITVDERPVRLPQYDVLILEVPTLQLKTAIKQFSIKFSKSQDFIFLNMAWDQTLVRVPIQNKN